MQPTPPAPAIQAPAAETPAVPANMTAEQAAQILQQASDAKIRACLQEIDGVLNKHNCTLDLTMTIGTNGVVPRIRVLPRATPSNGTDA
jgi:hypothetical protein